MEDNSYQSPVLPPPQKKNVMEQNYTNQIPISWTPLFE